MEEKPSPPSLRLGIDVPFDVAALDNLAHALDAVGSVAASCNCGSSALAALKRHTLMLLRDAADDRQAAVQELHGMPALFDVLPQEALMRVSQGMVAVFQSSALSCHS